MEPFRGSPLAQDEEDIDCHLYALSGDAFSTLEPCTRFAFFFNDHCMTLSFVVVSYNFGVA